MKNNPGPPPLKAPASQSRKNQKEGEKPDETQKLNF